MEIKKIKMNPMNSAAHIERGVGGQFFISKIGFPKDWKKKNCNHGCFFFSSL